MQYSERYLISGVFFQEQSGFGIRVEPIEGAVGTIRRGIGEFMYVGSLYLDPDHVLGAYAGTILDPLGHAYVKNAVITENEVRFEKRYANKRPHGSTIHYSFQPGQDAEWEGEYSSSELGICGPTRCVLTPITENFFHHNVVLKGRPASSW